MGTWDVGPFDNDGAVDLIARLASAEGGDFTLSLWTAMDAAVDDCDYLCDSAAQCAAAAAVIVAVGLGAHVIDRHIARLVAERCPTVSDDLRERAFLALDRISTRGDNEWFELWEEKGRLPVALEVLGRYQTALLPDDDFRPDPVPIA